MKTTIIVYFAALCLLVATAYPVDELVQPILKTEHLRVKRVTCDVLSVEAKGVKLNDAACALNCLIRHGKSGGYCNGQRVCICR